MVNVFAVPGTSASLHLQRSHLFCQLNGHVVFFICLRETLETSIIVSVLLAFLKQTLGPDRDPATYKKLVRQVSPVSTRSLTVRCLIVHRFGGEPDWASSFVSLSAEA